MKEEKEKLSNENLDYDSSLYDSNWTAPIDSDTQLNAKIISTDNKDKKIAFTFPKIKEELVVLPLLRKDKTPVLKDGKIVVYKIKKMKVFQGYETETIDFPFKDWFNDSTTSAFLTAKEARFVRMTDRLAFAMLIETIENYPKINRLKTIAQLGWVKASFTDSSKGIMGEAVKYAKSTFSKQENINRNYGSDEDYEKFKEAKKKKGILGLGFGPL